jgi:hypothetical protein
MKNKVKWNTQAPTGYPWECRNKVKHTTLHAFGINFIGYKWKAK